MSQAIINQIKDATEAKDASKLDLALRAQYHFENRGRAVDTTGIEFVAVKNIDPKFYG